MTVKPLRLFTSLLPFVLAALMPAHAAGYCARGPFIARFDGDYQLSREVKKAGIVPVKIYKDTPRDINKPEHFAVIYPINLKKSILRVQNYH